MHLLMQHLRWILAMNSAEFTLKNVELAVTVYPGMFTDANCWRIQSTKPERCWHLRLRKHWRCQLWRWDAYNWPRHFGCFSWFTTKKPVDWTSSWVSSHICSQRESLAEQIFFLTTVRWCDACSMTTKYFYFGLSFLVNFNKRCCSLCGNYHIPVSVFVNKW